jgi:CheY-like chemotaxis protein
VSDVSGPQRVLVVDDERDFRDQIRLSLESAGCEVETASSCREAVRMVPEYRPDVLVADWMLRDHLHGLHVSEVMGAVTPGMSTVLMTGYASADLRAEASGHNVCAFLEKPFEPAKLVAAVRSAAEDSAPDAHHPPIGVFQARPDGSIAWANEHARELFATTAAGAGAPNLESLVGKKESQRLATAPVLWEAVTPVGPRRKQSEPREPREPREPSEANAANSWHVLGKSLGNGGNLFVLLDGARLPVLRDHPVVQSLLGIEDSVPIRWNLEGHVLLVDDDEYVRRFVAGQLQRAGCPCLTAENGEVALRLFARDEQIRYVLLDWYLPGDDAADLVRQFQEIRPEVEIVGVSGEDRSEEFARTGITRFLAKPVRVESLMGELRTPTPNIGSSIGSNIGEGVDASPGGNGWPAPGREGHVGAAGRDESEWGRRLQEICAEFETFMQRRPGARATRAMTVVNVLCEAWPRSMTVQEIVDKLWVDPAQRMRRAAGSVRNALNTLARNFSDFNRTVTEPLHGVRCSVWRSDENDSRLCRYALRIRPVSESVEADVQVREYLAQLPRPTLETMYEFVKGNRRTLSPGADQACRDIGADLADPLFRGIVVQIVERRR